VGVGLPNILVCRRATAWKPMMELEQGIDVTIESLMTVSTPTMGIS